MLEEKKHINQEIQKQEKNGKALRDD